MRRKRIIVNGASGRMGSLTCETLAKQSAFELVGKAGHSDDLATMIQQTQADIVIDFTVADSAFENTQIILASNARPIIGTSGLSQEQITELQAYAAQMQMGGAIIPNFSLGAMVQNQLAVLATKYFQQMEIVEMHHDMKRDAPSSTAMNTAQQLAAARLAPPPKRDERETLTGVRGATLEGIPIHALRLAGIMAKETVYFGAPGETLSIEHQVISRDAYMPGLMLVCERVSQLPHLVYGLAEVLNFPT